MHCGMHQKQMIHHGCCCGPSIHRQFFSHDEKIKHLEQYKESLAREIKAVEKAIDQLHHE